MPGDPEKRRKTDDGGAVVTFGPPEDNNHNHRPKVFSDIKNSILDGEGTYKWALIKVTFKSE